MSRMLFTSKPRVGRDLDRELDEIVLLEVSHDPAEFFEEHHPLPPRRDRLLPSIEDHRVRDVRDLLDPGAVDDPLRQQEVDRRVPPLRDPLEPAQVRGELLPFGRIRVRDGELGQGVDDDQRTLWRCLEHGREPHDRGGVLRTALQSRDQVVRSVPFIRHGGGLEVLLGEVAEPDVVSLELRGKVLVEGEADLAPDVLLHLRKRDVQNLGREVRVLRVPPLEQCEVDDRGVNELERAGTDVAEQEHDRARGHAALHHGVERADPGWHPQGGSHDTLHSMIVTGHVDKGCEWRRHMVGVVPVFRGSFVRLHIGWLM